MISVYASQLILLCFCKWMSYFKKRKIFVDLKTMSSQNYLFLYTLRYPHFQDTLLIVYHCCGFERYKIYFPGKTDKQKLSSVKLRQLTTCFNTTRYNKGFFVCVCIFYLQNVRNWARNHELTMKGPPAIFFVLSLIYSLHLQNPAFDFWTFLNIQYACELLKSFQHIY